MTFVAACADEDADGTRGGPAACDPSFVATLRPAGPPAAVQVVSASEGSVFVTQLGSQQFPGSSAVASGLTVTHTQRETLPADRAAVVVFSTRAAPGPFGPSPLAAEDQRQVIERLSALGVPRSDVSFATNPQFGPFPSVSVVVPVADLKDRGPRIEAAIESVLGRSDTAGVQFFIGDCNRALEGLRRDGLRAAQEKARAIASAAGLTLGPVSALSEGLAPFSFGPPSDPCESAGGSVKTPRGGGLADYDAPPEVVAAVQLAVTYALGDTPPGLLAVTGVGSATARANEAYVIAAIHAGGFGPGGPRPIAARDRDDLLQRLSALGIPADDLRIIESGQGPPPAISVEVDLSRLAQQGEDVLDAIEAVFGRVDQRGVRFTHTNCLAVLAEAQKQALADARARAEALASVTGQRLGNISGVSTEVLVSPFEGPIGDPCADDDVQSLIYGPARSQLKQFDSEPLVEVRAGLRVSYAVAP